MIGWTIRNAIDKAEIAHEHFPELIAGQILLKIDSFALTANNITYALFGKPNGMFGEYGYWDFFAERSMPARLPVWGFAKVLESATEGINPGQRFYGYFPMASHALFNVGNITATAFTETTARRTALPALYNHYQAVDALVDYVPDQHDYWPIFRPLFLTGWLLADQFEEKDDYGAEQLLIASASSKTALSFAHAMRQRTRQPQLIGLTSPNHVRTLTELGLYDSVLSYNDLDMLDPEMPSAFVDMAGNDSVTLTVHHHFAHALEKSIFVGKSHWDATKQNGTLKGPEREFFFAPSRGEKRMADWGGRGFQDRFGKAWLAFMNSATSYTKIHNHNGADAALAAYNQIVAGKTNPKAGLVIKP
jgi:hypothetical protein